MKKILLLLLGAALLAGVAPVQNSLNRDRDRLGLTRIEPLQNAPPVLAFTTVALGGFRGLIANVLWMRANKLQQEDKFFEMVQLADWITKLEPHFAQVWAFEAWNMAWNISVKFTSPVDRWRWVQSGMELLRDEALRYNPNNPLLYQQLSWVFQSKIGQNLDDANAYYKQQWAKDMTPFFGPHGTNFDRLIDPQTPGEKALARELQNEYKIDPVFAKKVNEEWGPLDWRVPEAQAIYWAAVGLRQAKENPNRVKPSDLMQMRRSIYQSMLQAFHHGRLVTNPFDKSFALYPDLALIPKVNEAYLTMYAEEKDSGLKQNILNAQRNFLRDAVYFLYQDNQITRAEKWYQYLGKKFPDKPIIDGVTNSFPRNLTLEQYAVACVQENVNETSQDDVTAAVQGLLAKSYFNLAIGQDDRAAGFKLLAAKVYQSYEARTSGSGYSGKRIALPPFKDMDQMVRSRLLSAKGGLPFAMRAALRTQLRLPAETKTNSVAATTNTAPTSASSPSSSTNAPAPTAEK
ncbi:MAG TPA: hypothetical protein VKA67_03500 [Verrucomicrobiae bacterium]|nr:hypothetical protein [Verrucomicrobiae bacterium]